MSNYKNDGVPSWLTEDTVTKVASNPVVQKTAVNAASNPVVQKAVINTAKAKINDTAPGWADEPSTSINKGYTPPIVPGVNPSEIRPVKDIENQQLVTNREFDATPEELAEIRKYHSILRFCYGSTALTMAVNAVLYMDGASIAKIFLCLYILFFAVLMFCFELALKTVSKMIGMYLIIYFY